jgi:hypothetical protein
MLRLTNLGTHRINHVFTLFQHFLEASVEVVPVEEIKTAKPLLGQLLELLSQQADFICL